MEGFKKHDISDEEIEQPDQSHLKAVKKLLRKAKRPNQKGVCYLSRIPPYMNPTSLRKLMEAKFDGVERIYMEREKE